MVSIGIKAQTDTREYKKLNLLFEKGNYDKCELKARQLKKHNNKLIVTDYFLSKIELHKFITIDNKPNKKQFKHLKASAGYAKKCATNYPEWYYIVNRYYKAYVSSWADTTYTNNYVKQLVITYTKFFSDTLPEYYVYVNKTTGTEKTIEIDPVIFDNALRSKIITFATAYVGVKYKYGGETPETGFDCSGFVKYVYKHIDIELPHSAQLQSQLPGDTLLLEDALPGDLIFFGTRRGKKWKTQHAGIYYSDINNEPKVIHCVSRGVTIDGNNSSWDSYWKGRILFVKRLPQLTDN